MGSRVSKPSLDRNAHSDNESDEASDDDLTPSERAIKRGLISLDDAINIRDVFGRDLQEGEEPVKAAEWAQRAIWKRDHPEEWAKAMQEKLERITQRGDDTDCI